MQSGLKQAVAQRLQKHVTLYRAARSAFRLTRRFTHAAHALVPAPISESNALRQIGLSYLVDRIADRSVAWRQVLPYQTPRRAGYTISGIDEVLDSVDANIPSGFNAVYLAPDQWSRSPLAGMIADYPDGSGIKIMRRPGGMDTPYATLVRGRLVSRILGPTHRDLQLVHAFLFSCGIAPRPHDVIELNVEDGRGHMAYVLSHLEGSPASESQWNEVLDRLEQLVDKDLIRIIHPMYYRAAGYDSELARGNFLVGRGRDHAMFLDLEDIGLFRYDRYLAEVATEAAGIVAERDAVPGGRAEGRTAPASHLIPQLPGAEFKGTLDRALAAAGVRVGEKVVLDPRCGIGIMAAEYLRLGARWVHGWDGAAVVGVAERVLLSMGCTRFSLGAHDAGAGEPYRLPRFLERVEGCDVILAVGDDGGWLETAIPLVERLPWRRLIYATDEQGSGEAHRQIRDLANRLDCGVSAIERDAGSGGAIRVIAILEREWPTATLALNAPDAAQQRADLIL